MPTKLHVANLDRERAVDKQDLEDLFKEFGRISDIWVARQPPGFAFVTFDDERDADDAIKALDGKRFQGDHLRVQVSNNSKGNRDGRGGGGGGGRGGRSRSRRRRDSRSRSPPRKRRSPSRSDSRRRRR
eukprot:TRINITY_DN86552_c0_g1_i1.p1 TRINITY_DN86552_c0_g1~~TRINITY_DN86552_c0_g1_i1.p1  ORF type:complete len:129 (+),score=21.84 TRINITY_DN86552_c0_g1_i1:63-449(+)